MEIKVISVENNEGTRSSELVSLFEGSEISHRFVFYKDKTEFQEKTHDLIKNLTGSILGIDLSFWNQNDESAIKDGYFLFIMYQKNDDCPSFIICKMSDVYITNKGQTIDKISII
jgi:hypothetical protein